MTIEEWTKRQEKWEWSNPSLIGEVECSRSISPEDGFANGHTQERGVNTMNIVRRKCFISYHHADQAEVDQFVRTFDHERNLFIARGLGQTMAQDIIDSTDTDYVMRRIRDLYIADSTVTLVMLGKCTWARRYVDWEIQASLRTPQNGLPNGLLGVKLPTFPEGGFFPERFNKNLLSEEKKAAGQGCFARWMAYPQTTDALWTAIEDAFQRRTTHANLIENPRDRFTNNRQCE